MTESEKSLEPAQHIENGAPYGKRQKAKRHCARFWWLWFFVFAALVLVVVLPIIYVAFPNLAQKAVNQASNEVVALQFLNPTPNSVQVTQYTVVDSPSKYSVTLDPFTAGTYLVTNGTYADTPIIYVDIPEAHVHHPTSELDVVNYTAQINNMDQLIDYTVQVMLSENVTTALTGKTKLHLGKLPTTTVKYNTSSSYRALNKLSGFNVSDTIINATAGTIRGNAQIPNPSSMTIELADVTFDLNTTKSGKVGEIFMPDLIIRPGNTTLPYSGTINQTLVLQNLDTQGFIDLNVCGTTSIANGEHLVYYEAALASTCFPLHLNVPVIVAASTGGS